MEIRFTFPRGAHDRGPHNRARYVSGLLLNKKFAYCLRVRVGVGPGRNDRGCKQIDQLVVDPLDCLDDLLGHDGRFEDLLGDEFLIAVGKCGAHVNKNLRNEFKSLFQFTSNQA